MSDNKFLNKSVLLPILALVILAVGSFYFFSTMSKDSHEGHDHSTHEESHDHDHDHDHNIDANKEANNTINLPGEAGKIHPLSVNSALGRRGVGDPNAPVKVQEFFSLTCNHCADFHTDVYPLIKENLIDTGKLYFVYEEFPLNGPALYGSMIARCMPDERYAGFIDLLLRNQEKWAFGGDFKSALKQNAMLAGLSEEAFEECYGDAELQKAMASNIQEASDAWKISSTPSFVFNDGARIFRGGHSYADFEAIVNNLTANAPKRQSTVPALEELQQEINEIGNEIEAVIEQNTETQEDQY